MLVAHHPLGYCIDFRLFTRNAPLPVAEGGSTSNGAVRVRKAALLDPNEHQSDSGSIDIRTTNYKA